MPWLAEYQQVVFADSLGFPYRWPTVRGVLWHTTEGWRAEDAFTVYKSFPSCPHITAEWENGTERVVTQRLFQHVDTARSAYAVQHGDDSHPCAVDTNASGIVQVELVGFSVESGGWPVERLKWIGEKVLAPILAAHPTIPPWVYPLASPRMSEDQWEAWPGGQCRHADICCQPQQHGDPGDMDLDVVLHYALEYNAANPPGGDDDMTPADIDALSTAIVDKFFAHPLTLNSGLPPVSVGTNVEGWFVFMHQELNEFRLGEEASK